MTTYVAFLRAVNVGGTGKLPMADLRAMCESIGLSLKHTEVIFDEPDWAHKTFLFEKSLFHHRV
mgnify:CR=1 FL=1